MASFTFRTTRSALPVLLTMAAALALTPSCTEPKSEGCGEGFYCPVGSHCAAEQQVCIYTDCGDGKEQPGELCDDGNVKDGDGCSADCLSTEGCGDGFVNEAAGELCDDGNTDDGDGCSSNCRSFEKCGNGIKDVGEMCDDGNTESLDGCREDCRSDEECGNSVLDTQLGEVCDPGLDPDNCNTDCTSNLECGNETVDFLLGERCDDGNASDNDACTNECKVAVCGDGLLWNTKGGSEECDDGGESAACNDDCTVAVCGDGKVNSRAEEECDDGTDLNGTYDHCSVDCMFDGVRCGDGVRQGLEVCDGDDISSAATEDGGVCLQDCSGYEPYCGDGRENQSSEECDDGTNDGSYGTCTEICELAAFCGDGGDPDPEEECDDGTADNKETPAYRSSAANAECSTTCELGPHCGDDLVQDQETCDDGDENGDTGKCREDCSGACGDQLINGNGVETCEFTTRSGGAIEIDASGVELDSAFSCRADDCTYCGDKTRNGDEVCDNPTDDEATPESGLCYDDCLGYCGDKEHQPEHDEACDNPTNTEGTPANGLCYDDCSGHCGDGVTQDGSSEDQPAHGEECDDANDSNTDACLSNCQEAFCGDGHTWTGHEECDDGNDNNSDSCTNNCEDNP